MKTPWKIFSLVALAVAVAFSSRASAQELTIAGSGGVLEEIVSKIYDVPFTKATGIKVTPIATTNRESAVRAMQVAGNTIWDITELSGAEYTIMSKAGWLVPLDWAKIDPQNRIAKEYRLPDAIPYTSFAHTLGYRTDKAPAGKKMTSWADFWDVKTFPGPRGMRDLAEANLEFALLADGVPKADVYKVLSTPQGVDRAFAKLDQIKPNISLWYKTSGQPTQALKDGEVFYTTAPNGRFTVLADEGKIPVEIVWNGAHTRGYWAAVKGTKQTEAAMKWLAYFIESPERAAEFAKQIPYPGYTAGMLALLPPEKQKIMPTFPANLAGQFNIDEVFWANNRKAISERWQAWQSKR